MIFWLGRAGPPTNLWVWDLLSERHQSVVDKKADLKLNFASQTALNLFPISRDFEQHSRQGKTLFNKLLQVSLKPPYFNVVPSTKGSGDVVGFNNSKWRASDDLFDLKLILQALNASWRSHCFVFANEWIWLRSFSWKRSWSTRTRVNMSSSNLWKLWTREDLTN